MLTFDEILERINYWQNTDRIGPDNPWTHWRLHFPNQMRKLCIKKFKNFGDESAIRPGCYIVGCSQISIGKRVVIRPGSMIHAETDSLDLSVEIDDNVLIGSGVHIYVENHRFDNLNIPIIEQGHSQSLKVNIKSNSWIGANTIILPGVNIGKHTVIGAGSVVTKNIDDYSVAVGNPAKMIKRLK